MSMQLFWSFLLVFGVCLLLYGGAKAMDEENTPTAKACEIIGEIAFIGWIISCILLIWRV